MVAGIIVAAVGNETVIAHPTDRLSGRHIAAVVAGPALYLLAHVLFRLRMSGTLSWKRFGGAVACVAVAAAGPFAPAVVLAALVVAVLAAVIGLEQQSGARRRARGEPAPHELLVEAPDLDRAARDEPA
jgi:low temperature requirement protein LtrA